ARGGAFGDALTAFSTVAARLPDFAPAHFNRGWAAEEAGALDLARASFERACEVDPANPEPRARLALLTARLGAAADARAWATQALALAPEHPGARLALARAELLAGQAAAAAELSRALADDPRTSPFERTEALGTLGDALDAADRTAEAFA